MGFFRRTTIGLLSEVSWRLPGWPVKLLTAFSQSERGSAYDVLYAIEHTDRRDLRLRYFRHAMDEARHAGVFVQRAQALGGADRTLAVLGDAGYLSSHGIIGNETLFERYGEMGFLAFVYVAEADAVEQFKVYIDRQLPDEDTLSVLHGILKDERFHVSYSRAALKHYDPAAVKRAIFKIRLDRFKERWLRGSIHIGHAVNSIWLSLMYLLVVAPFRAVARLDGGGFQAPRPQQLSGLAAARSQG
jgi:hypothetical protein